MLHSLYCGYPASLDAAGKALGLPQDKQKLTTGKALIKYFCTPCAKTITNGGRTRNLPGHDPGEVGAVREYNRQDVVTEMEIEHRLSRFPVPERVQREWEYDMRISARGVAADRELVDGALYCGTAIEEAAKQEAIELTGLENPKSREQMLIWLQGHGVAIPDLRSATVEDALEHKDEFEPEAARVLELRRCFPRRVSRSTARSLLPCARTAASAVCCSSTAQTVPDDGQGGLCRCRTCRVLICTALCWTPLAI